MPYRNGNNKKNELPRVLHNIPVQDMDQHEENAKDHICNSDIGYFYRLGKKIPSEHEFLHDYRR